MSLMSIAPIAQVEAWLLQLPLDRHIANIIEFMRPQADVLGLRGSL